LAYGLIEKTLEHYKQKGEIRMENEDQTGERVKITIELKD
jgi:hypothetical protein